MTGFARNRRRRKPDQRPTSPAGDRDGPVDDVSGLTSWQASRWREVTRTGSHSIIGNGTARTNMIAGLRALADFLEANPAAPIPRYGHDFGISTSGSDEEKRSQVKFASLAIGEDVTDDTNNGQCWTQRQFGSVRYRIFAVSDAAVQRYQRAVKSQRDAEPRANRFSGSEDDR